MQTMYLILIAVLFVLAVFDLWVGVSNDAVNFLNSAIGSKVATLRTIIIVAAIGVFSGAAISNGMFDIARHGIFRPEQFCFSELMCIFMAVMLTDVLLLDVFNSLGMPTSTTVSLVFELLGGTFALACIKIAGSDALDFSMLLNTEKALSVILGIFISVGIAFVAGALVQWLARLLFSFNYRPRLKYWIGIFGGVSITAILYFVLIKVLGKSPWMPAAAQDFIAANTGWLMLGSFVLLTVLMEVLYFCKVNVFKIIVLFGTFALAMAFASNDLVNFVGVPLAAFSAYQDFAGSGLEAGACMMDSLNSPAATPIYFLLLAGLIMVVSLAKSSKAQNVVQTSVNLSRQAEGEEMFGGSRLARSLVRGANRCAVAIDAVTPKCVSRWIDSRFNKDEVILADGAAFDLVRASVNLVLAGLLIILGTTLKLPLSTTYVTFIVAMGTSLADRAWSRESAVYRITGVLSVIGGWLLTAAIAFVAAALVALVFYYGGTIAMLLVAAFALFVLWRMNHKKQDKEEQATYDVLEDCYRKMSACESTSEMWALLKEHHRLGSGSMLSQTGKMYEETCSMLFEENLRGLRRDCRMLDDTQQWKKKLRSRELMALRRLDPAVALEKNTWFHLGSNAGDQMLYCLKRIAGPARDHIDNGFTPLTAEQVALLQPVVKATADYFRQAQTVYTKTGEEVNAFRTEVSAYQEQISAIRKQYIDHLTLEDDPAPRQTELLTLNILQESQQLLSELRHFLRAYNYFDA